MMYYIKSYGNLFLFLIILTANCVSTGSAEYIREKINSDTAEFLQVDKGAKEIFRVLLTSEKYIVAQMKYQKSIKRADDPGGDKYISSEILKMNKIDEAREGIITIWLYPDSGKIMKMRPQKPTYIVEVDRLITEDIQRWNFIFPKKYVATTKFNIRYRVVLQKKLSDEEIIKEVRQKMRDGH
ncbi:hypothetical protein ACFL20_07205 [Spirochaetota bacterium]